MATKVELLRAVVLAKAAYWDALKELENECVGEEGFDDNANNEIIDLIDALAAGLNSEDASCITGRHVETMDAIITKHW